MAARFTKLPKHKNILLGIDVGNIFKYGHVYEIREIMGEHLIIDLGKTALAEKGCPSSYSTLDEIIEYKSPFLLTVEEYQKILEEKK